MDIEKYTYQMAWSVENQEHVATVAEFPSLSWLDSDRKQAELGLLGLVAEVVEDMEASGERIPEPLGGRSYSGKFNVRTSPSLHRHLVIEAKTEGISLNALINQRLASPNLTDAADPEGRQISDFYVDQMPCDEDLLFELGRVNWAAARLQFTVRDALNKLRGQPSDRTFDVPLGRAINDLKKESSKSGLTEIVGWVDEYGRPASKVRNSVIHAVTYTASDGKQALMTTATHGRKRLQNPELRSASWTLLNASMNFPAQALEDNLS